MPLTSFAETIPLMSAQLWLPVDGTNTKIIVAAQPTIWRMDTLLAINDDNTAHTMTVTLIDPTSTIHGIGGVTIPALAGHPPNAQYDILAALLPATQQGLAFPAGWAIEMTPAVAATSAIGIVATGGYF